MANLYEEEFCEEFLLKIDYHQKWQEESLRKNKKSSVESSNPEGDI